MEIRKKIGFFLGPLLFLLVYFSPFLSQNPGAHDLLAVFLLVVVWWVTECIPIPVTALMIPIFLTALRICSVTDAFAPFANPIIMLFLGSFVLARAMCVHALDQRLAFSVLSIRGIANRKSRILFSLGLTSVFLSFWVSNTATTAMMFPIALGAAAQLDVSPLPYMMAIMFGASASFMTPIGYQTNLMVMGPGGYRFSDYLRVGVPISVVACAVTVGLP